MPRKNGQFIFNAFIIALVVMAIMHAFAPYIGVPKEKLREISDLRLQFVTLNAQQISEKLVSKNGKPTMMVVYASWCKYCRELMPKIIAAEQDGTLAGLNTIYLSRDREGEQLALYLVKSGYQRLVTPYIIDGPDAESVQAMLTAKGSGYAGGIPYIAFFDSKGNFTHELAGAVSQNRLLEAITSASTKTR